VYKSNRFGGGSVMVWSSICPDLKIVEGTEQDVIVCLVRIKGFHASIDVKDNKHLFWF
jgi:hypothetical protein